MKLLFSIWGYFLPFYLPNSLKNQHLKKMKKTHGEWSFYMFTTNDNCMRYGSWDTKHDRHNFLSFWALICMLTSITTQKIKTLKKLKKKKKTHSWRYHFYTCAPKTTIIWHTVHETWNAADIIWAIFCPFTSLLTMIHKILKKWNNTLQILSFYTCVP